MDSESKQVVIGFYAQATYFIESSALATKHAQIKKAEHPTAWNNFETVIVGTSHAFAIELLLKGLRIADGHSTRNELRNQHNLYKILSLPEFATLKSKIVNKFNESPGSYCADANGEFKNLMKQHAEMFVKMRYACETQPPTLDMSFTSFICNELYSELKCKLGY